MNVYFYWIYSFNLDLYSMVISGPLEHNFYKDKTELFYALDLGGANFHVLQGSTGFENEQQKFPSSYAYSLHFFCLLILVTFACITMSSFLVDFVT